MKENDNGKHNINRGFFSSIYISDWLLLGKIFIKMTLNQSWKRQRELKTKDIPEQESIYNTISQIQDEIERVLMVMTYLTGGRISEITQKKYLYKNTFATEEVFDARQNRNIVKLKKNENGSPIITKREKIEINYVGVRKTDITFKEQDGKAIMVISIANRKNKQYTRKNLPIPVFREEKFVNIVKQYLDKLQLDEPLFKFQDWRARLIINKHGFNPHFIRDIRLTHMVTIYNFDGFQLTKFAGWKNVIPSEKYIRLGTKDLVRNY